MSWRSDEGKDQNRNKAEDFKQYDLWPVDDQGKCYSISGAVVVDSGERENITKWM